MTSAASDHGTSKAEIPRVNPENGFSGGSWWHSLPADIDGDGKKEIVNHYWNFYGFWSIDVKGPDSYRYPTPGVDTLTNPKAKNFYHEYYPEGCHCLYGRPGCRRERRWCAGNRGNHLR